MTDIVTTDEDKIPDLDGFVTYYGLRLSDIGDDGAVIILGHHDRRRALAALNRHARTLWGFADLYDGRRPSYPLTMDVTQRWAILLTRCDDPKHQEDCRKCRDIAASDCWWIQYDAAETDEGAFPVMVWSV